MFTVFSLSVHPFVVIIGNGLKYLMLSTGIMHAVPISVRSYVQLPCCVQNALFRYPCSPLLALGVFQFHLAP